MPETCRLWKLSGGLHRCPEADAVATIGTWSLADDFPEEHVCCESLFVSNPPSMHSVDVSRKCEGVVQETATVKYRRGVVHKRHFGIVHRQKAFFSNFEGDIVGLVQRRKWYKPWRVHTESYDVDASPGLVVPGMLTVAACCWPSFSHSSAKKWCTQ